MQLLLYPDLRLGRPAAPVAQFGPALDPIIEGVAAIMREAGALGLTAAHCGCCLRLVVVQPPGGDRRVYANPVVVFASADMAEHEEGSVSMPGLRATVSRAARIRVAFQDRDGDRHEEEFAGFDAAVLLHEIDQLDGIFWLDRLSRLKRERLIKRHRKLGGRS